MIVEGRRSQRAAGAGAAVTVAAGFRSSQAGNIFTTHTETPHAGSIGRYLEHFRGPIAVGHIADLHLALPLAPLLKAETLDLDGIEIRGVQGLLRDSLYGWGFDTRRCVLAQR